MACVGRKNLKVGQCRGETVERVVIQALAGPGFKLEKETTVPRVYISD
jgi:hypothetical protein